MKSTIWLASALSLYFAATAGAQLRVAPEMRYQEMDTDHNWEISRAEWRGSDRSFRNQDWNGDGKLSGNEIRVGAQRKGRGAVGTTGTQDRFVDLDSNHDGRLTLAEWHGSAIVFDALDANGDGTLTREEAIGANTAGQTEFTNLDVNGDGAIARAEWQWNAAAFDRLDANHDGRLSLQEFGSSTVTPQPPQQQSAPYRAGYARGQSDGVQAGREDKPRHWDLEGQRELETADAGYEGRLGSLTDYQAGYRAGFRLGYREGFGPRD
jgi:hypothetical protein